MCKAQPKWAVWHYKNTKPVIQSLKWMHSALPGYVKLIHRFLLTQHYEQSLLRPDIFFPPDAPKIHGAVAVYTWEGNAVNISCEVTAHPSEVSIVWLRDGLQLPNSNTTNIRIFRTSSASYLQVCTHVKPRFTLQNNGEILLYIHKGFHLCTQGHTLCHQDFMSINLK